MTNKALDNLASITSGVDLGQIPPIHQKRLLTFVNHFIITTVNFLNHFAQTCEGKLISCDQKMQKLEAELCILEAKLNSIPGLEDAPVTTPVTPSQLTDTVSVADKPTEECSPPASLSALPPTEEEEPSESEIANPPAARNPELTRFFKMIQFGVPLPAVKQKMQQEGFNPDLLDSVS